MFPHQLLAIGAIVFCAVYFTVGGGSSSSDSTQLYEDDLGLMPPSGAFPLPAASSPAKSNPGASMPAGALQFAPDNTFKIVQFTDLHYGEDDSFDLKTDQVQRTVLAAEKPNLVVFSGDQVSSWLGANITGWYAQQWQKLIKPVKDANIPYAIILGNHDDEGDLNRRQVVQLDIDTGGKLTRTKQGLPTLTGASNYYPDIWNPQGTAVGARLWLLDSMDRGCGYLKTDGWGCVEQDVVQWVNTTIQTLPKVPSMAFIHIPIPSFMALWNQFQVNGTKGEPVACPILDTGVFGVAKAVGITAIWSGHCHDNDYHGLMTGPNPADGAVKLGFGRKSGYGAYGPKDRTKGGMVHELKLGQDMAYNDVWVRDETGAKLVLPPATVKGAQQTICSE